MSQATFRYTARAFPVIGELIAVSTFMTGCIVLAAWPRWSEGGGNDTRGTHRRR
jgi:hypothetical protein